MRQKMRFIIMRLVIIVPLFSYVIYGLGYSGMLWILALLIYHITECRSKTNKFKMIKIKVKSNPKVKLPQKHSPHSVGMDVYNVSEEAVVIPPMGRLLVSTGLSVEVPIIADSKAVFLDLQVRPRSGLALNHGITLANCIGTIDSDYRGDIGVILINLSNEPYTLSPYERIGQLVLMEHKPFIWDVVEDLEETERGESGFGSTGY